MIKHRGFPGRMPGTDFQFTIRRENKDGCAHHGDPATDSMNIRPPIPRRSGHRFHEHPATLV